jgi:hypothetical protein
MTNNELTPDSGQYGTTGWADTGSGESAPGGDLASVEAPGASQLNSARPAPQQGSPRPRRPSDLTESRRHRRQVKKILLRIPGCTLDARGRLQGVSGEQTEHARTMADLDLLIEDIRERITDGRVARLTRNGTMSPAARQLQQLIGARANVQVRLFPPNAKKRGSLW